MAAAVIYHQTIHYWADCSGLLKCGSKSNLAVSLSIGSISLFISSILWRYFFENKSGSNVSVIENLILGAFSGIIISAATFIVFFFVFHFTVSPYLGMMAK